MHDRISQTSSRSEGFPRTGYFIPGRDGTGAWQISCVVPMTARACLLFYEDCLAFPIFIFLVFLAVGTLILSNTLFLENHDAYCRNSKL